MKFFQKKPKIEPVKEPETSNECAILLHLKDGQLEIKVDWSDDLDPKYVGAIIGSIATAEIVGPILQEVTDYLRAKGREEELETIHEVVKFRIAKHHQKALEEAGRNRPVVEPFQAIRRQLTMFQPQQG